MKTAELEGKILDYYVALALGHVWRCKWMLEEEGYNAWQSYERGWGNPTPPYSTDWAHCGPLIVTQDFDLCRDSITKIWHSTNEAASASGRTPEEAICRAVVALHFGQDVPDVAL